MSMAVVFPFEGTGAGADCLCGTVCQLQADGEEVGAILGR